MAAKGTRERERERETTTKTTSTEKIRGRILKKS
jgi:hypothetical protein